jgi:hypothetical protein
MDLELDLDNPGSDPLPPEYWTENQWQVRYRRFRNSQGMEIIETILRAISDTQTFNG